MRYKPVLRVLSDDQVYDIQQADLEILWKTGVLVKSEKARKLLKIAGAVIDEEKMICRIPSFISIPRIPTSLLVG